MLRLVLGISLVVLPAFAEESKIYTYTFLEVGVKDASGQRADEKFFISRLPVEGEAVEMVYVGRDDKTGDMRFQLRVRYP